MNQPPPPPPTEDQPQMQAPNISEAQKRYFAACQKIALLQAGVANMNAQAINNKALTGLIGHLLGMAMSRELEITALAQLLSDRGVITMDQYFEKFAELTEIVTNNFAAAIAEAKQKGPQILIAQGELPKGRIR